MIKVLSLYAGMLLVVNSSALGYGIALLKKHGYKQKVREGAIIPTPFEVLGIDPTDDIEEIRMMKSQLINFYSYPMEGNHNKQEEGTRKMHSNKIQKAFNTLNELYEQGTLKDYCKK